MKLQQTYLIIDQVMLIRAFSVELFLLSLLLHHNYLQNPETEDLTDFSLLKESVSLYYLNLLLIRRLVF